MAHINNRPHVGRGNGNGNGRRNGNGNGRTTRSGTQPDWDPNSVMRKRSHKRRRKIRKPV